MTTSSCFPPVLVLALVVPALAPAAETPGDLVLRGGVVHTNDPTRPRATGVVVRGDRIVAVLGADDAGAAWIGTATRVVDLAGACVTPGLWDAHGHLLSLGLGEREVDLVGTRSFAEVIERVAARARETPAGTWIVGRGWDQNDWPKDEFAGEFPTHARLSAATPDHPVLISRVDGHAALANARAMALARLDADVDSPEGGEVVRDATGALTGVLVDAALSLVPEPDPTVAETRAAMLAAARRCAAAGLVGVHDAGMGQGALDALEGLYAEQAYPLRVYAMLQNGPAFQRWLERGPAIGLHDGLLTVRSVKLFMDGALGSRGAALLAPYSDAPDVAGLPQMDPDGLAALVKVATRRGFQVCTHAIGDGGVRRVLDGYELAARALPPGALAKLRPRIEHAQVIAPDDLPRLVALGALPSMQPTHCTSDMPWAEARLGPERVRGAYAWRSLLRAGVTAIPMGSDFPVEGENPLWGFHAAVTRLDADGGSPHGPGGWYPDERLTREEALLGFTRWAAVGAFQEEEGGAIAPGRWADLTVLGADLLTCEASALRDLPVRMTIVAGRVAFEAP